MYFALTKVSAIYEKLTITERNAYTETPFVGHNVIVYCRIFEKMSLKACQMQTHAEIRFDVNTLLQINEFQ